MTRLDPCPLGKWIWKLLALQENLLVPDNRIGLLQRLFLDQGEDKEALPELCQAFEVATA